MSLGERNIAIVRECLQRVLDSPVFSRASRQSAFLRHVVENGLTGNLEALKEYQIGLSVYGRGASYDTRADPIVRVEASRLRSKLREYYETAGSDDPVRFEVPKGSYVPVFHWREAAAEDVAEAAAAPEEQSGEGGRSGGFWQRSWPRLLAAAGLLALIPAAWWILRNRSAAPPGGMPRSIAIVPFRDLSGSGANKELCDALAEALTEELSRVEGLQVAGRTSTLRLSGQNTDLRELGRQLNVGAVLEGSAQSASGLVRIRARMFDVGTGFQLWSGTFDRTSTEAFAVQDEIARAIASTLRLQLGRRREDASRLSSPKRLKAHDLFVKGRQLHRRGDPAVLEEARGYHLKAVEADPDYPLAHSGLAHIDITIMSEGLRPAGELRVETVQSIEKALALDPALSDAFSARVRLARDVDHDWPEVEATCREVTRMFPNAASVRGNCGAAYAILGRFSQAEEELRAAVRLDPLWPGGLDGLAWMLYIAGRHDEALRQAQALMKVDPAFKGARRTYARILIGSGRLKQAREYLESELAKAPESADLWALLGYVRGKLNDRAGAHECRAKLGPKPLQVDETFIWLGLGDQERAAGHLAAALDNRESAAIDVLVDPALEFGPHARRLRAKVKL